MNRDCCAFLGRDAELTTLTGMLDGLGPGPGRPSVALVEGDAGIGKTALLDRLRRHAGARGWRTIAGWADGPEDMTPYGLLWDTVGPTELLPALRPVEGWSGGGSPGQRQELYQRLRAELATAAGRTGMLVTLEDLQWADPESVEALAALVRRPPAGPVVLVLSSRPDKVPAAVERAVGALGPAVRLRLGPLGAEAVAGLYPTATRRRQRLLHAASRGNPSYLDTLADLPTPALAELADGPGTPVPAAGDAVLAELRALPESARLVAGAAAVLGDVDCDLIAEVGELDPETVAAGVDLLAARDVLRCTGGRPAFRHPVVRAAAYQLAAPAWRLAAHRRAAAVLAARGVDPVRRAPHVAAAAQVGDAAAAALLVASARTTLDADPARAAGWLEAALRVLPAGRDELRAEAAVLLARACCRTGDPARAAALLHRLPRTGRQAAAAALELARCERTLGHLDEAYAVLAAELAGGSAAPDEAAALRLELATVTIAQGRAPAPAGAPDGGLGLAAAAAAAAALGSLGADCGTEQRRLTDRAADLADRLDDAQLDRALDHLHLLCWAEYHLDRPAAARRHAERGLRRAGPAPATPCLQLVVAATAARQGDLLTAALAADEAAEQSAELGDVEHGALAAAAGLLPALWRQGPAAAQARLAVAAGPEAVVSPWAHALVAAAEAEALLALGRPEAARRTAGAGLEATAAGGPDRVRLLALAATADLGAGDTAGAVVLAAAAGRLARTAGQRGDAALAAARVAQVTGDGTAAGAAATALAAYEEAGLPVAVALTRLVVAEIARCAGDLGRAEEELGLAKRAFAAAGADWLVERAVNEQRRLGASRPHSAPATPDGLSRREREIAGLLCEGLTNKVIAERLVLSVRTVDSHVARILTKLGVSSRMAAARKLTALPA